MKDKIIVYKTLEGKVAIVTPAPEMFDPSSRTRQQLAGLGVSFGSEEDIWNFIINRSIPEGITSYSVTDKEDVPEDRTFRDALDFDHVSKEFSCDMVKAKEIHKDVLREIRKPLLEQLDIDFMKSIEQGDSKATADIIAKKEELRDVTSLEMPNTAEELKEFMPECLK